MQTERQNAWYRGPRSAAPLTALGRAAACDLARLLPILFQQQSEIAGLESYHEDLAESVAAVQHLRHQIRYYLRGR